MEETLKLILNKLQSLEEGQTRLEDKFTGLESKIDKLDKIENEHFDLLLEEQNRIYNSLDSKLDKVIEKLDSHEIRISALEARV